MERGGGGWGRGGGGEIPPLGLHEVKATKKSLARSLVIGRWVVTTFVKSADHRI